MICATVKVKREPSADNPSGVVIINESDFVEGQDELYTEGQETVVISTGSKEEKAATTRVPKTPKAASQPWNKTE